MECNAIKLTHEAHLSFNVIEAMQQPIKKGERCLILFNGVEETHVENDIIDAKLKDFHPFHLRLPDSFQEKEKPIMYGFTQSDLIDLRYVCDVLNKTPQELKNETKKPEPPKCDSAHLHCECKADRVEFNKFPPDPVEEKIKEFVNKLNRTTDPIAKSSTWWYGRQSIEEALRELVDLVRRER